METKHTPGPWRVGRCKKPIAGRPWFVKPDDLFTIYVRKEADARLIASAPDLLAERDALRERNKELREALTEIVNRPTRQAGYVQARAALAKQED